MKKGTTAFLWGMKLHRGEVPTLLLHWYTVLGGDGQDPTTSSDEVMALPQAIPGFLLSNARW